jgi:probable HAF family extracellular repeat protein
MFTTRTRTTGRKARSVVIRVSQCLIPLAALLTMRTEAARAVTPPIVDLGTLGGTISSSTAINNNGQIVGYSTAVDGTYHPFSWTAAGGMIDVGSLGGAFGEAVAVNNRGHVVGWSYPAGSTTGHAFSWTAAGAQLTSAPSAVPPATRQR